MRELPLIWCIPLSDFIFDGHKQESNADRTTKGVDQESDNSDYPNNITARVIVAGQTTKTSQKVHNLLCGMAAVSSDSEYVLCLDDDVLMHDSALAELVAYKRFYPASLLVTGYPLDVVSKKAGLMSYCMMAYHLPLSIPFSLRDETQFVWGGCMLFDSKDLALDSQIVGGSWQVSDNDCICNFCVIESWNVRMQMNQMAVSNSKVRLGKIKQDGGYSDDLIVAALSTALRRSVITPPTACFMSVLPDTVSFYQYWNYLRRQASHRLLQ